MKYLFLIFFLAFQLNSFEQSIAPDFNLTDTHGITRNLYTELDSGKTVILDFFITNCGTCQTNTITLENIWQTFGYNGDSVWVWGIEISGASDSVVEIFDNQFSATFPTFSTEFNNSIVNLYSITYTPQYIVVCPFHFMKKVSVDAIVPNLLGCNESLQKNEIILNYKKAWFNIDNTEIHLNFSLENYPMDLFIYNSLGNIIYTEKVKDINRSISLNNKTPGLYFISLQNKNGTKMTEKFIIY